MIENPPEIRAEMACGYLPQREGVESPFCHEADKGVPYQICPGYTTDLPEVVDIAAAWCHWSKGIDTIPRGHSWARDAVLLLDGASERLQSFKHEKKAKERGQ